MNSRFKALPEEQKKTLTREIARYVLANYRRAGKLETVNVGFVTQKSFMNFNYTDYSDSQQYLVSELKNGEM